MTALLTKKRNSPFLYLFIFISFYLSPVNAANAYFNRGDLTIGAQSNYMFQIETDDRPIPAGEVINIKFPAGYTLPSGALSTCTLSTLSTKTPLKGLDCSIPTIAISARQSFSLEVGTITNPFEVVGAVFYISSTNLGKLAITNKKLEEAPIQIDSVVVETPKVQETTNYIIRFKLSNPIPKGGRINVKFPSTTTDIIYVYTDSVIMNYEYDGSTNTYPADFEDETKVVIADPFQNEGYTQVDSYIVMTINNIENQQFIGLSGEIELKTLSASGKGINRGVFRVEITQGGQIYDQTVEVDGSNLINEIADLSISFRLDISFDDGFNGPYFYIKIDLPDGFEVQDSVYCTLPRGLVRPNTGSVSPECRKIDDLTVYLVFVIYSSPGIPAAIRLTGIKNPSSTRPVTQPVTITVYQSSTMNLDMPKLIATGSYDWEYSAKPGSLVINGITRDEKELEKPIVLRFNINVPDTMEQDAKIVIQIPTNQVAFSSNPICERIISTAATVRITYLMESDEDNTIFTLTDVCQVASQCTKGTNFVFKFSTNTYNPKFVALPMPDSIQIMTKTPDGKFLYHSNLDNLYITPALEHFIPTELLYQKIGTESKIVNKPFSLSMKFTPHETILRGGYVFLHFPQDVVFPEDDASSVICSYYDVNGDPEDSNENGNHETDECVLVNHPDLSSFKTIGMPICNNPSNFCTDPITFTITGLKNPGNTRPIPTDDPKDFWAIETGLSSKKRIDYKVLTTELPDVQVAPNKFTIKEFKSTDKTVAEVSSYSLQFVVETPIPTESDLNGQITVTIPPELSLTTNAKSSSSCVATLLPETSLLCEQDTSAIPNKILITPNIEASSVEEGSQILLTAFVRNPLNTKPSASFTIMSSSKVGDKDYPIDIYQENELSVTAVPNSFSGVSLTVEPPYVGSKAINTFQFTPSTSIPPSSTYNSRIIIQLPSTMKLLKLTEPDPCTATTDTLTLTCDYMTTSSPQAIVISHSESSLALSDTPITVVIPAGVLQSPGSTKPTDNILIKSVSTIDGKDYVIDTLPSDFINDKVNQPGQITVFSAKKETSRISKPTDLTISFVPINTLPTNSLISISLPKEQILLSSDMKNLQVSYQKSPVTLISPEETDTDINFSLVTPCNPCPSDITLYLTGFINPSEVVPFTKSIQLLTKTPDGSYLIDGVTSNFFTTPRLTGGDLLDFKMTSSSLVVGTSTDLTMTFALATELDAQAKLMINFPKNLYFGSDRGVSCNDISSGSASQLMCKSTSGVSDYPSPISSIEILIGGQCQPLCPQGTPFSIQIQGLKNAFTLAPPQGVVTVSSVEGGIAMDSSVIKAESLPKLVPGNLAVLKALRTETTVGKQTELTLSLKAATMVLSTNKVTVDFSKSHQFTLSPSAKVECMLINPQTSQALKSLPCISSDKNSLVISEIWSDGKDNGEKEFAFTIKGINNINYVKSELSPTDSLAIATTDASGYVSDQADNGIQVTPSLVYGELPLISSLATNRNINKKTEWTFSIRLSTTLEVNNQLLIELPPHTFYPQSSASDIKCLVDSTIHLACEVAVYEGPNFGIPSIMINNICGESSPCVAGRSVDIAIQGIKNPSIVYVDDEEISLSTQNSGSDGNLYKVDEFHDTWKNLLGPLIPGEISFFSITGNLPYPGVLTNITVMFANVNPIPYGGEIVLILEDEFIIPDFTEVEQKCKNIAGFSQNLQCKKQGNQLILVDDIESSYMPSILAFNLLNVLNPQNPSKKFRGNFITDVSLTTRNAEGLLIDISPKSFDYKLDSLSQDLVCDDKCLTCIDKSDICTSCHLPSDFPLLSGNSCVNECPDGFIFDTNVCIPCYPGCASCTGPLYNQCIQCEKSLFLLDGQCVEECPDSTQAEATSNICSAIGECSLNCATCSKDPAFCLSCDKPFILDVKQHMCINPSEITCSDPFFFDQTEGKCMPCNPQCASCTSSADQCTLCSPLFRPYLDVKQETAKCVFECPPSTFVDSENKCQPCDPSCLTCSGPSKSECISCQKESSNSKLEYGECVETCNPNYKYDGHLQQCILPCTDNGCFQCQADNLDACLVCKDGFFLDGTNCVPLQTCPIGEFFLTDSKTCTGCNPSCKSCSLSAANCTSCRTEFTPPIILNPKNLEFLYDSECLQACPLGFSGNFKDDKKCKEYECLPPCKFCNGASNSCFTCLDSTPYKYNDFCYATCPEGTGPSKGPTGDICVDLGKPNESEGLNEFIEPETLEEKKFNGTIIALIGGTGLCFMTLLISNILSIMRGTPMNNTDSIIVLTQILEVFSKCMLIPNIWGIEDGLLFFTVLTLIFNIMLGINFNVLYLPLYENNVQTVKGFMQGNKKIGKAGKVLTYSGGSHMLRLFRSGLFGKQAQFERLNGYEEIQRKHVRVAMLATGTQMLVDILILVMVSKRRDAYGIASFNLGYNATILTCSFWEFMKTKGVTKGKEFLKKALNKDNMVQKME